MIKIDVGRVPPQWRQLRFDGTSTEHIRYDVQLAWSGGSVNRIPTHYEHTHTHAVLGMRNASLTSGTNFTRALLPDRVCHGTCVPPLRLFQAARSRSR